MTDSTRYALPALRFKICCLLSGNVWNKELTIIQSCILRKLRNKKSLSRERFIQENRGVIGSVRSVFQENRGVIVSVSLSHLFSKKAKKEKSKEIDLEKSNKEETQNINPTN